MIKYKTFKLNIEIVVRLVDTACGYSFLRFPPQYSFNLIYKSANYHLLNYISMILLNNCMRIIYYAHIITLSVKDTL